MTLTCASYDPNLRFKTHVGWLNGVVMQSCVKDSSGLPIQKIIQYITGLTATGQTVLPGVAGGAGAGKTTFTRWLADCLKKHVTPVSIVLTDLIYRPIAERWTGPIDDMPIGYDLDWERIRDEVVLPLKQGKTARFRLYNWVTDCLDEVVEITAEGVTIVEAYLRCGMNWRYITICAYGFLARLRFDYPDFCSEGIHPGLRSITGCP
jgi:hypothetical protein